KASQIRRQFSCRLVAMGRIAGDGLEDDRFQVARNRRHPSSWRPGFLMCQLMDQFAAVDLRKSWSMDQHLIKRQPQAVDVAADVRKARETLRRQVAQSADHVPGKR